MRVVRGEDAKGNIFTCPKCGGSVFMDGRSLIRHNGKRMTAGLKAKICASCMANGEVTIL